MIPNSKHASLRRARILRSIQMHPVLRWGSYCDGNSGRGPWTSADLCRHINELELLVELYAVQFLTKIFWGPFLHFYLDNTTTVAYINRDCGTHSKQRCNLAKLLCEWCEDRNPSNRPSICRAYKTLWQTNHPKCFS